MWAFISWLWPVWYLIVFPSYFFEIPTYIYVFVLYGYLIYTKIFPVFWIDSFFKHIDTCMCNMRKPLVKCADTLKCLTKRHKRKSENKVNIHRYLVYSKRKTLESLKNSFTIWSMDFLEARITECLDSERDAVYPEFH